MLATTLLTLSGLASFGTAQYVLQDDYSTDSFFSMFDFFTGTDPTEGYVSYVDQSSASSANLISTNNNTVYMGVDYTNVASGSGRQSVRLTSKNSYNTGLVIIDLEHMPGSVCGTWPAFWMLGPDWPTNGEIDIIEGVNSQVGNAMTLHTGPGCTISDTTTFSGSIRTSNCYVDASGQANNAGCGITTSASTSYGDGFNAVNGGVYATEITSEGISIWNFPRSSIPSDISSGSPDPSGWGEATASFSGSCDFSSSFKSLQIVFDTTFCGTWAGTVWSSDATCSGKASTCEDFVQNNPSAFQDSYWSINSLKVYSGSSSNSGGSSSTTQSVSVSVPITATESISTYASESWPTSQSWATGTGSISSGFTVPGTTESASTPTETSTSAYGSEWGWGHGRPSWTHFNEGNYYAAPTPTTLETVPVQKRDTATSAPEVGVVEESIVVKAMARMKRSIVDSQEGVSEKVQKHVLDHSKRSHWMRRMWKA